MDKKPKKTKTKTNVFFEPLTKKFLKETGVAEKKMFGTTALTFKGKVFAFPWKGNLILKLPQDRVMEIVSSKSGVYFDPGHGRTSKEWIEVKSAAQDKWLKLAQEAKKFVDKK